MHDKKNDKTSCLGGAVGSVAVRAAWLRWSANLGSRPRLAGSLCQVILNSRAKERKKERKKEKNDKTHHKKYDKMYDKMHYKM